MTGEGFVRQHWKSVCFWILDKGDYGVSLGGRFDMRRKTPDALWSAAAEFTRARLEEIRQVEEEVRQLENEMDGDWFANELRTNPCSWGERPISVVVSQHRIARILAREQEALADLKRGLAQPSNPEGE